MKRLWESQTRVHVYVHVIIVVHDREGIYERCEWLHRVCV